MAKASSFKQIAKGLKARLAVKIDTLDGDPIDVAILPLSAGDEAECIADAIRFAEARGVKDPKPGDRLYEKGLMVAIVLRSVIDPDPAIPEDKPERFFDGGAEQILAILDPERLALLYQSQRQHQSTVMPTTLNWTPYDYIKMVLTLAAEEGESESFFPLGGLPYATQRRFVQLLVRDHLIALRLLSLSGWDGATGLENSENSTSNVSAFLAVLTGTPTQKSESEENSPSPKRQG